MSPASSPLDPRYRDQADRRSHGSQNIEHRGARGIQADVVDHQVRIRQHHRRRQKENSRGDIAGDVHGASDKVRFAVDAHRVAIDIHARAELGESEFGMIARSNRFNHGGHALGEKPGEKYRRFHLRAGNAGSVYSIAESGVPSILRGSAAAIARFDPRAHFRQGLDHAPHWTTSQGGVAVDFRAKPLPGKNTREQPHRRAGVSRVQGAPRFSQSVEAHSGDSNVVSLSFYFDSETREAIEGAAAISSCGKMGDFARTLGQRREHGVAVGDGFITGNFERSGDDAGGTNDSF